MPIKMMTTDRGAGPVIICDFCHERITDASQANYIWDDDGAGAGDLSDVYFVHSTQECDKGLQNRVGKIMDNSQELSLMIPYLIDNLNVDMEHAKKYAALASEDIG